MTFGAPEVTLETTAGAFTVELYYEHAPKTCTNFVQLARRGYYDGVAFHRVIRDFMLQGGDPTGTGRGGESAFGGKFEDEITSVRAGPARSPRPGRNGEALMSPPSRPPPLPSPQALKHTGAGVLSMANAGPNTNGSQFFVTLAPTPWYARRHAGRWPASMCGPLALGV